MSDTMTELHRALMKALRSTSAFIIAPSITISAFTAAELTSAKASKALLVMEGAMKALVDLQRLHQRAVQSMPGATTVSTILPSTGKCFVCLIKFYFFIFITLRLCITLQSVTILLTVHSSRRV